MRTRRDLAVFVASLPLPKERREIVQMELEDHVFESIAELEASGVERADAERRSVEALGEPEVLGAQLVEAQLAYAITPRRAIFLGVRTGLFVAAVALVVGYFDGNPHWRIPDLVRYVKWMEPSPLFYVVSALALLAAWPRSVIRPFLSAQRHAIAARRAGNVTAVRRLQEPISNFFGALITSASAPFLFWILAVGIGLPIGHIEGLLLRSLLASFVVNVVAVAISSILLLQASPEGTRNRGRLA